MSLNPPQNRCESYKSNESNESNEEGDFVATITARLDDTTKVQLDKFCRDVGLNTSTIMKMFATKVVREQNCPF
jgi:methylphosphotriester-DNA--protein-cysteine methyltransferase